MLRHRKARMATTQGGTVSSWRQDRGSRASRLPSCSGLVTPDSPGEDGLGGSSSGRSMRMVAGEPRERDKGLTPPSRSPLAPPGKTAPEPGPEIDPHHGRLHSHQPLQHSLRSAGAWLGGPAPGPEGDRPAGPPGQLASPAGCRPSGPWGQPCRTLARCCTHE